jgi:hypothetical protein
MKNGKVLTLDERIAHILQADESRASSVFADLIAEVDDAIDAADQAGREAREIAGNPKIIDGGALGRALDAEHTAHRLRNGMAALEQLHHEALAREKLRDWHLQADLVEEKAAQLADELLERWPAMTTWILDYFARKAAVDAQVKALNATTPGFESRRLKEIELVARGIEGYGNSQPLEKQLRLPALVVGSQSAVPLLWPLPQHIGLELVGSLFPRNGTPVPLNEQCLGFEVRVIDGVDVVCEIGRPPIYTGEVAPLHPEMSLREQKLAEEAVRTVESAKHAAEGRAREREREHMSSISHNEELRRRQEGISK